jgi:hypothetical protein
MSTEFLQLIEKRDAIKLRLLELDVIDAERAVAYYVNGIPTAPSEKAKVGFERARLRMELEPITVRMRELRRQTSEAVRRSYAATITRLLIDNGLIDLVRQARLQSADHDHPAFEDSES